MREFQHKLDDEKATPVSEVIRVKWPDVLVALALLAVMAGALIRWPDKTLVDVALPTAVLILFVLWRER